MREDDIVKIAHRCIDESPRIHRIESESHRQGLLMEAMLADIRRLIEIVVSMDSRLNQAVGLQETMERHADRLDAVEHTLKRHIKDRRAHRSVETSK